MLHPRNTDIDLKRSLKGLPMSTHTTELPITEEQSETSRAGGRVYVETYGCQMNVADTEIVLSVLASDGYLPSDSIENADVILLNTCSIRDNAEQKIHHRLEHITHHKKSRPGVVVGVLGCMAERLRKDLLQEGSVVDMVVGPDEYRSLPHLVSEARSGEKGLAVKLSRVETYDDIVPLRTEGISAWLSVMRGCDKFCTYCVVPFTRGRERSRSLATIVDEVTYLRDHGFKEVTLLGQNVNSYRSEGEDFADLLAACAAVDSSIRIRYTTSHPQDMSDNLIETMAEWENICNYIHLPFQSGSNRILELMNRTYTAEHYLERIDRIRQIMPDAALSTDVIAGFPTETDADHEATLRLMREVRYDGAYMFKYSPRERTKAWNMGDDVPEDVKGARLQEIIDLQNSISLELNEKRIGRTVEVLVEGASKREASEWMGRTRENNVVIFPHADQQIGEYISVRIERATSATLFGSEITAEGRIKSIPVEMIAPVR